MRSSSLFRHCGLEPGPRATHSPSKLASAADIVVFDHHFGWISVSRNPQVRIIRVIEPSPPSRRYNV